MVVTILGIGLLLPYLTYAFFTEPFTAFASSFIKIGSTLDETIDAVTNIANASIQHSMSAAHSGHRMLNKQITNIKKQISNTATRQHSMLKRSLPAVLQAMQAGAATARLLVGQGKHRMLGAKEVAFDATKAAFALLSRAGGKTSGVEEKSATADLSNTSDGGEPSLAKTTPALISVPLNTASPKRERELLLV